MSKQVKMIFVIYSIALMSLPALADTVVITNKPLSEHDVRYKYTEQLLTLALNETQKTHGEFKVKQAQEVMARARVFRALLLGEEIHVMAEAPKPQWVKELLVVNIPIRKGIQGYRLFLITKNNEHIMSSVHSLKELKSLSTGSGQQWSTRAVMEKAGFTVVAGNSYDSLFRMLKQGRFETFGRGINEAFRELKEYKSMVPTLMVDKSVALYIPLPTYFFVSPKKPELADRIELGLSKMMKNGSFDTFFYEYHCQDLKKAKLSSRRIFSIPNINLAEHNTEFDDQFMLKVGDIATACQ